MLILAPFGAKISILRGSGTPVILRRYLNVMQTVKSQNAVSVNPASSSYFVQLLESIEVFLFIDDVPQRTLARNWGRKVYKMQGVSFEGVV